MVKDELTVISHFYLDQYQQPHQGLISARRVQSRSHFRQLPMSLLRRCGGIYILSFNTFIFTSATPATHPGLFI